MTNVAWDISVADATRRSTAIEWERAAARPLYDAECRALNVAVALIGLVLSLPIMLIIAAAVRLSSRGPVIYRQWRVGLDRRRPGTRRGEHDGDGRLFVLYKFRTMSDERRSGQSRASGSGAAQVWAQRGDPRVTRIGRLLRRSRLDELPQLFNVLLGDMNVVGPRPEQPDIVRHLRREVAGYDARLSVRPGITGLAQVSLPYDQSIDDVRRKVALDIEYLRRRSPLADLEIMLRTPLVMLNGRGAL
jgi:lipopolysaccharide/colanic/teichoic acid biosynthesis glycosyltransferase